MRRISQKTTKIRKKRGREEGREGGKRGPTPFGWCNRENKTKK